MWLSKKQKETYPRIVRLCSGFYAVQVARDGFVAMHCLQVINLNSVSESVVLFDTLEEAKSVFNRYVGKYKIAEVY